MSQRILIVGGTGMLGLPVAHQLKEDGFDVTILTTNMEAARARLGDAFRLVKGDVTSVDTLRAPMEGQDFVFLNLNAKLDPELYEKIEVKGTANAARVAGEMGIKRIGLISGASSQGTETGVIYLDSKVRAERAVMESGVAFSIMRPSWFFETLPMFIQNGKAAIFGKQPVRRSWLAARDYARQVSNAFQKDEAADKCFYNLGPVKLTMMEVLQKFCLRHHPEVKPKSIPFALARVMALMPGVGMLRRALPFFRFFETLRKQTACLGLT